MTMQIDEDAAFRQALLTSPAERQDVEYKSSQPFDDSTEFGLKLIKHILGMANAGGGWVVIGYLDKPMLQPDPSHSDIVTATYEPTKLSNAVNQCVERGQQVRLTVFSETHPTNGLRYPIIHVGGFERLPYICRSTKGSVLVQGDVYVRRSGAETSKILSVQDWDELIGRCVSQQRDEFLAQFADLSRRIAAGNATPPDDIKKVLDNLTSERRSQSILHRSLPTGAGCIEFAHTLVTTPVSNWSNHHLLNAVSNNRVDWPHYNDSVSLTDGIGARIRFQDSRTLAGDWHLAKNGTYYRAKLLMEDYEQPSFTTSSGHPSNSLWFDLAVVRIAQALRSSAALYERLGIAPNEPYLFSIRHEGLNGRTLYASSPFYPSYTAYPRVCSEDTHQYQKEITRDLVESQLFELTHEIANSLFELFAFAGVSLEMVTRLITEHVLRWEQFA